MKKHFLLILILLFQTGIAQKIEDKSLLWEISGKNLSGPSYLYGTIHIACQGDVIMTDAMQNAFDNTKELVLEANIGDPGVAMKMMQFSLSKDGKKLSEKLGPEVSAKLDEMIKINLGVNLDALDNLNPQTMLAQMSLFGMDCPMDLGYDMMLMKDAMATGKPVGELESIDEQFRVLFSQPDEEAVKAISYLVMHPDELKDETKKMFKYYHEQSIQELYDMARKTMEDSDYPQPDYTELLDNRNIKWIPIIEQKIAEKPTFIAVGAMHLAGEQGVINLLRKQGYTLKPVK